jgi:hypothetical protein
MAAHRISVLWRVSKLDENPKENELISERPLTNLGSASHLERQAKNSL